MRLLFALVGIAVAIGLGPQSRADPAEADARFVATLDNVGITYRSVDSVIAVGKKVCELMDDGMSGVDVVNAVIEKNPGFASDRAAKFVTIAASVYCPQHLASGGGAEESNE
jgi:hypothetical protein